MPRRCSSCWPAHTSSEPATARSSESLWPNVEAALDWIDRYGDRDGDGFVEYDRQSADGLLHQGWKDSDEAIFHADGTPARGPIALCEVQGYVYAARRAGAALADRARASGAARRAERRRPSRCASGSSRPSGARSYRPTPWPWTARSEPCRVRTSNAGQCLFTGIANPERARRVARTLLAPESFSGWGVRTLAASESSL